MQTLRMAVILISSLFGALIFQYRDQIIAAIISMLVPLLVLIPFLMWTDKRLKEIEAAPDNNKQNILLVIGKLAATVYTVFLSIWSSVIIYAVLALVSLGVSTQVVGLWPLLYLVGRCAAAAVLLRALWIAMPAPTVDKDKPALRTRWWEKGESLLGITVLIFLFMTGGRFLL